MIINNKVMDKHIPNQRLSGVKGMLAACCMSLSLVGLSLVIPNNQMVNLLGVIILPFIVALIFLKNVMCALTLTWLNEMFLGVGGAWLDVGPISGRGALLLLVLFIYFIAKPSVVYDIMRHKRNSWIVFYGTIFPCMLLGYSVFIMGNTLSGAMGDVQRFLIIMIYFPFRDLIHRYFSFFLGWLVCVIATLSLLTASLAVAPDKLKMILFNNWFFSFAGTDDAMLSVVLSSGRAAFTPLILCMIGVFLGILYTVEIKGKPLVRLGGAVLLSVSLAPFVISFLRGPIIGILIMLTILSVLSFGFKARRFLRTFILAIGISTVGGLGYIATIYYIPTALEKWNVRGLTIMEIVDPSRIEQTEEMLTAWFDEPFLGKGVGSPLSSYARDESGLAFEVQYPMILYRVGLIGFGFIMAPLLWVLSRIVSRIKQNPELISTDEGKLFLAIGCSVGSLMITSWVNPYLATSMTFVFILIFLGVDSRLSIIR